MSIRIHVPVLFVLIFSACTRKYQAECRILINPPGLTVQRAQIKPSPEYIAEMMEPMHIKSQTLEREVVFLEKEMNAQREKVEQAEDERSKFLINLGLPPEATNPAIPESAWKAYAKVSEKIARETDRLNEIRSKIAQEGIGIGIPRMSIELIDPAEPPER